MKGKYAFIDFESVTDATAAIAAMNGKQFRGYDLCVEATRKYFYSNHPEGTAPGQNRRTTTGPSSRDECFKCGKLGHWANECRGGGGGGDRDRRGGNGGGDRYRRRSRSNSPRRRSRSPPRGGDRRGRSRSGSREDGRSKELKEGRCFICKEKGHIKRDCPDINSRYGGNRGGGDRGSGRYEERDRVDRRRSRSPPRRTYRRRDSPSRSPPRRREYSRSRSPPRRFARASRSPSYH